MFTNLRNVQITISLLKQFSIKKIVISPGSRNMPFVHSVEQDDYFECYSIVDERSAGYFALGLSAKADEIVVLTCTSSTATANYLPSLLNVKENKARIVALTFDRDYRKLYKMEDQMIDQIKMYGKAVMCSVNIPIIRDAMDEWYSITEINKAFLYFNKNIGAVQVNVQIDDFGSFDCSTLPKTRKISSVSINAFESCCEEFQKILLEKERIMVYCCQDFQNDNEMRHLLEQFQEKFNSIISYDEFSVAKSDKFIKTCLVTESMYLEEFERFCPDIVITIGGHSWSFMKYKLRHLSNNFEHWHIDESGVIRDAFNALTMVFEIDPKIFFANINNKNCVSNKKYYNLWRERLSKVIIPPLEYSNFLVIKMLAGRIPDGSLVHLSILNSIRLYNFVGGPQNCEVYANLGTDGIDGCLSTFIGQSMFTDKLSFLIIGDLSSLYDMSAFQYLNNGNQRVLIINNHVGSEFYNNFRSYIDTIDKHIGASHKNSLESVCELASIKYISASNFTDLEKGLEMFVNTNDKPILFEIFTDPNIDTKMLGEYYRINLYRDNKIVLKKIMKKLHLIK